MSAEPITVSGIDCAPWCVDGDGHPDDICRADQNCWGVQHKVVLGLEDGAPALPMTSVSSDAPGLTVYAYKQWHGLPHLRLNVFREHDNPHLSVDHDLDVTASEARQLAVYLLAV